MKGDNELAEAIDRARAKAAEWRAEADRVGQPTARKLRRHATDLEKSCNWWEAEMESGWAGWKK